VSGLGDPQVTGERDEQAPVGARLHPGQDDGVGPLTTDIAGVAEAGLVGLVGHEGPGVRPEDEEVDGPGKALGQLHVDFGGGPQLVVEVPRTAGQAAGGEHADQHQGQEAAPQEGAHGGREGCTHGKR
jgi:hypothetical protein